MHLSAAQVGVMRDAVRSAPDRVREVASRIAQGEVVPDSDAMAVVDAMTEAMLSDEGFDGEELTGWGRQIDDCIGIVQQYSEHFYD